MKTATMAQVESVDDFFAKGGPLPTSFNDVRRFPRFYFRTCAEAIIHPYCNGQSSAPVQCFVLTCDLSRSGLSLLHSKQLFPGQRVDIILNGEPPRHLEVVWCRRLAVHRYAIGCRFRKTTKASS
jgi:PilZ domain